MGVGMYGGNRVTNSSSVVIHSSKGYLVHRPASPEEKAIWIECCYADDQHVCIIR